MLRPEDIPPVPSPYFDYWRNRCKDGSRPKVISNELRIPWGDSDTPPGEPPFKPEDPWHKQAETRNEQAEREHLERLQLVVQFHKKMVQAGMAELETIAPASEAPSAPSEALSARSVGLQSNDRAEAQRASSDRVVAVSEGNNNGNGNAKPAVADAPGCKGGGKGGGTRARLANPEVKPLSILTLASRSAKELIKASAELRDAELKYNRTNADAEMRRDFMLDRAVSIVTDTMMHMDKTFADVGFGNWMPFRFPDQWIMFGGVMQRVLAAHGLMHADTPEAYKRLLEETPPITEVAQGALIPPQSIGRDSDVQSVPTFKALIERIMEARKTRGPPA